MALATLEVVVNGHAPHEKSHRALRRYRGGPRDDHGDHRKTECSPIALAALMCGAPTTVIPRLS